MASKLSVEIVTPERRVLSVQADQAIVPGSQGRFGVLPGHTPFLTDPNGLAKNIERAALCKSDGLTKVKQPPDPC